jgi:hypothetical protein
VGSSDNMNKENDSNSEKMRKHVLFDDTPDIREI